MKYLQIHKFPFKNVIFLDIDQNILENSSKTCLLPGLVAFPNGPSAPIGRIENFAKSFPLSTKRKLSILLDFPFPAAPFSGVFFNLEKINTGLVNHRMSYLTFVSLLRIFSRPHSFAFGPRDSKRFGREEKKSLGIRQD